jgi:hypothetical protein
MHTVTAYKVHLTVRLVHLLAFAACSRQLVKTETLLAVISNNFSNYISKQTPQLSAMTHAFILRNPHGSGRGDAETSWMPPPQYEIQNVQQQWKQNDCDTHFRHHKRNEMITESLTRIFNNLLQLC